MTDRNPVTLTQLRDEAHDNALEHGFYSQIEAELRFLATHDMNIMASHVRRDFVVSQIGKISAEAGEAIGAIQRHGVFHEDVAEELADVIIRTLDLAGWLDINIEKAVKRKMKFNRSRPIMHGKTC